MTAYSDGLATVDIDEAWSIASYKDDITTILSVVRPVDTTVSASDTTTSFTLTAGLATADAYNGMAIQVQDADDTDDNWIERQIEDWTAGRVVTVDTALPFTPAVADKIRIIGTVYGGGSGGATAEEVADAVWDELSTGHVSAGKAGEQLWTDIDAILDDTSAFDTDAEIASAVWDALVASYTTETTFGGEVGGLDPNITLILADTAEIQTDQKDGGRLDLLWDAIKYKTDLISLRDTTVSDANDANSFTLTAGIDVNDAHDYDIIMVTDADDGHSEIRWIWYWASSRVVIVDRPFGFTPAVGDVVHIMGTGYGGWLVDILIRSSQNPETVYDFRPPTLGGGTGGTGGTGRLNVDDEDP